MAILLSKLLYLLPAQSVFLPHFEETLDLLCRLVYGNSIPRPPTHYKPLSTQPQDAVGFS